MRIVKLSLVLGLLCACSTPRADSACPEPAAATPKIEGLTLDADLREIASSATKVHRIELRFDQSGALVKQAVYHDAAAAVPEPVFALAEREFPESTVVHHESERYADLGAVHEVEVETTDGRECEVSGRADGTLLYTECEIDPATLPEPVAAAIAAAAPEAKIIEAKHKRLVEGQARFVVEVEGAGRVLIFQVAPDGSLLAKHFAVPALIELQL